MLGRTGSGSIAPTPWVNRVLCRPHRRFSIFFRRDTNDEAPNIRPHTRRRMAQRRMKKHLRMIDGVSLRKRLPSILHGRELGQQTVNNAPSLIVTVSNLIVIITMALHICVSLLLPPSACNSLDIQTMSRSSVLLFIYRFFGQLGICPQCKFDRTLYLLPVSSERLRNTEHRGN